MQTETKTIIETLPTKIKSIKRLIKEEYLNDTKRPWLIGFSGGKDSTLLLHLIVDVLMNISPGSLHMQLITVMPLWLYRKNLIKIRGLK